MATLRVTQGTMQLVGASGNGSYLSIAITTDKDLPPLVIEVDGMGDYEKPAEGRSE